MTDQIQVWLVAHLLEVFAVYAIVALIALGMMLQLFKSADPGTLMVIAIFWPGVVFVIFGMSIVFILSPEMPAESTIKRCSKGEDW